MQDRGARERCTVASSNLISWRRCAGVRQAGGLAEQAKVVAPYLPQPSCGLIAHAPAAGFQTAVV